MGGEMNCNFIILVRTLSVGNNKNKKIFIMQLSLKAKFLLSICLTIFALGSLAVVFVFFYSRNSLIATRKESLELTIGGMANDVNQTLVQGELLAKEVANHDTIIDYFTGSKQYQDQHILHDLNNFNALKNYSAIYILSADGTALVSTDPAFVGNNYAFREYFKKALSGNPYVDAVKGVTSGKMGYYFSHPIYDAGGKLVGVVVAKMEPQAVNEAISLIANPNIFKVMFTDQNGIILFSNKDDRIFKSLGLLSDIERAKVIEERRFEGLDIQPMQYSFIKEKIRSVDENHIVTVEFYDEHDKEDEILSIAKIKGFPFFVVLEQDVEKITAPAFNLAGILSLFVLLSVLFAVIIITSIVSRYLHPLEKFNKTARKISEGDYSASLEADHTSVEFDKLATVFNKMIEDIKFSRENITKQVEIQTRKISKHNEEMEKQQKVVMNTLNEVKAGKKIADDAVSDLQKFKLAVDSASDHVVITDKEGIVLYLNQAAEKITGYKISDAIGKKAAALWAAPMPKEFYTKMWETIKTQKKSFSGEIQNRRENGEIYTASVTISPVLDKNNEVIFFVGLERDITKEKAIDKAKSEFASIASHQLRTPLTAINWYVEILRSGDSGKLNKDQRQFLDQVYLSSQRMVKLVNELLNVSRIESGRLKVEPEDTDLITFIKDVIRELEHLASQRKCKLVFKSPKEKLPTIPIDQTLMRQVIFNLLTNAVRYSSLEGGKVGINLEKKGTDYVICVSDDGIGIPLLAKEHLYEKFYRADNARAQVADGSGLGLYLVKMIVETYGGKLWFESPTKTRKSKSGQTEEFGTNFYITLPVGGMRSREGEKGLSLDKA